MKLTKSQERRLRKKLKVKASDEDVFIRIFLDDLKSEIGDRIRRAETVADVDEIIDSLDQKELKKHIRALSNKMLINNNRGFSEIINALADGYKKLDKKKKDEKKFIKAARELVKKEHLTSPIMKIFEKNMMMIKDLPKEAYKALKKAYLTGSSFRGTEFEKLLYERMGDRAKLIVRTESSKVNSALTEVRSRSLGVNAYVWSTSGDARVRDTHSILDGVLIFWDKAPKFIHIAKSGKRSEDIHHAGNIYNCRCIPLPVFSISDIQFPIKVAEGAVITERYLKKDTYELSATGINSYTKVQFLKKYGNRFISSPDELQRLIAEG